MGCNVGSFSNEIYTRSRIFFHSQASCNNFLSHQIEKETIRITTCSVANTQIHNATTIWFRDGGKGGPGGQLPLHILVDLESIKLFHLTLSKTQYDWRKIEPVTMKANFIHFWCVESEFIVKRTNFVFSFFVLGHFCNVLL